MPKKHSELRNPGLRPQHEQFFDKVLGIASSKFGLSEDFYLSRTRPKKDLRARNACLIVALWRFPTAEGYFASKLQISTQHSAKIFGDFAKDRHADEELFEMYTALKEKTAWL